MSKGPFAGVPARSGLDVLLTDKLGLIKGRRVGLITNHTGVDGRLQSGVDRLANHRDVRLTALFGPEHGLRGDVQAGDEVASYTDERTGLPVYSLYGATKDTRKPTAEMLADVDILLCDLQDGGSRYFTYVYTMAYALEAAAEAGIAYAVLDRPNPIGGAAVEGNVLHPDFRSFVGAYALPMRHGMTMGEIATLLNANYDIGADLHVIPMDGWRRDAYFWETGLPWVSPSPNVPTPHTLVAYPGTCLFEGTNMSEGRGTTRPFEWIGAPWIDGHAWSEQLNGLSLAGVMFRPVHFTPTFSKHHGVPCQGVEVHVTDPRQFRPVATGLHLLATARDQNPDEFAWLPPYRPGGRQFIDLLAGTDALRLGLDAGRDVDDFLEAWEQDAEQWLPLRERSLLYE